MSLFKNINVISYHVQDWEKAKKFYTEVLEWPVAYVDDNLGWMEFGLENETHLAISRGDPGSPVPPKQGGAIAVFTVEDAVKTTELLRSRGVKCDDAENIPNVIYFGTFYDPEGNIIQFASSPK